MSDQIAKMLSNQFSTAIYWSRFLSQEKLTNDIMNIYQSNGTKSLASVLNAIIKIILRIC